MRLCRVRFLTTSCLLTGGVAFRRGRDRILGVWPNHFLSTLVALPVLASFWYWALTIGVFLLCPLSAVGLVDVVKALDFTGLGSLLVHSIPAKTYCQDLLQHPFALVVSAALVAYYLSVATVWAERAAPIFHSHPQLGEFHLLYQSTSLCLVLCGRLDVTHACLQLGGCHPNAGDVQASYLQYQHTATP